MKKRIFKISPIILTIMLLFGSLLSFRVDSKADSLPPEKGNLYIHKYYLEDLDLAGEPNKGEELDKSKIPSSAIPLPGITFKLYKVSPDANGDYPRGKNIVLNGETSITDEGKTYNITPAGSITSGNDGIALSGELDRGVYLVVEQKSATISIQGKDVDVNPVDPFVVSVPMTNPTGTGWMENVHVYPKNEGLVTEKIVETTLSNNIGDTVSYRINAKVPNGIYDEDATIDGKIKYSIKDTLDEALTLNTNSIKVYLTDSEKADVTNGNLLIKDTDYTVSENFIVDFTRAGRNKLSNSKYLAVTFDTVINNKILDKEVTRVGNKATTNFTNKNGDEFEKETPTVNVHTSTIKIKKISSRDSGQLLDGVEFKIASSEDNAKNSKFLRKDSNGNILDVGDVGYDTATDWVETTTANGIAKFAGIKGYTSTVTDGVESDIKYLSYWLVETKAKEGFNLLDTPVKATFDESSSTGEGATYTIESTIKNSPKGLLPRTGSNIAIILTVLGIVFLGFGVIVQIFSKKKHNVK
ncbi:SpaH/EbpB family LPXTG-anchored major pilin [Miniphocaeibacter massiliensis]|uniref:SpaH/EbpB family LPXTG-anchored major pilin n=1 Tax=Miniphocaeibacter massiliensis TaxID=2041841 RepID=UPI000C1C6437|nr:SpaH/EbpB family LPXTG-anchored major pilin [Miniphocaeibacter massiliensis]